MFSTVTPSARVRPTSPVPDSTESKKAATSPTPNPQPPTAVDVARPSPGDSNAGKTVAAALAAAYAALPSLTSAMSSLRSRLISASNWSPQTARASLQRSGLQHSKMHPDQLVRKTNRLQAQNAVDDLVVGTKFLEKKYPSTSDMPKIAVIGGGYAGTVTSAQTMKYLEKARKPAAITIFEKDVESQRGGGLAYGHSTAGKEHFLNLQNGRVTYDRELPEDCTNWLATRYPKRKITTSTKISRRDYRDYLINRLLSRLSHAPVGTQLNWEQSEVLSINNQESHVRIDTPDKTENYDAVVVATGHLPLQAPTQVKNIAHLKNVIVGQYARTSRERMAEIIQSNPNCNIIVIGCGLSSFDAILTAQELGHRGKLFAISRGGYRHFSYPEGYIHSTIDLPKPDEISQIDKMTTVAEFEFLALESFTKAMIEVKKIEPKIDNGLAHEKILKAMEPYFVELFERLSPDVASTILIKHKSLLTANRVGVIPEIGEIISKAENEGRVEFISSSITSAENKDEIQVCLGNGRVLNGALLVISAGSENNYNYTQIDTLPKLWGNLISQGVAAPHALGGVQANPQAQLLGSTGRPHDRIYVSGVPVTGEAIVKRGRVGPFVMNTGEIRDWSKVVAKNMVETIFNGLPTDSLALAPKAPRAG
jgi:uncharacterized NAD(P)/FAD-binding protein YdhS